MSWLSSRRIGLLVALLTTALGGCRNQSTAMTNPFLGPDRVPPPATRVIAPGTAQPYYPGDPLPAAQAAPPAAAPVAQAQAEVPASPTTVATASAEPLAFSNERSVSIPSDSNELRFALPAPPEPPPQPHPMASSAPPPATQPAPAPGPASQVVPASFALPSQPPITPIPDEEPAASGMWRSPQVRPPNVAAPSGVVQTAMDQPVAPQPAPAPPPTATSTMPVELRAVPSPAVQPMLQPVPTPPPRIRFPNFFGMSSAPASAQPMAVMPAPSAGLQSAPAAAAPSPSATVPVVSPDGFRPRGSGK